MEKDIIYIIIKTIIMVNFNLMNLTEMVYNLK